MKISGNKQALPSSLPLTDPQAGQRNKHSKTMPSFRAKGIIRSSAKKCYPPQKPFPGIQKRNVHTTDHSASLFKETRKKSDQATAATSGRLYTDNPEAPPKKSPTAPENPVPTSRVCKPQASAIKFLVYESYKGDCAELVRKIHGYPIAIKVTNRIVIAQRWGTIRKNPGMTYAKLSQVLRNHNNIELIPNPYRRFFVLNMDNLKLLKHWTTAVTEYSAAALSKTIPAMTNDADAL